MSSVLDVFGISASGSKKANDASRNSRRLRSVSVLSKGPGQRRKGSRQRRKGGRYAGCGSRTADGIAIPSAVQRA
jgi:hypothetical protein